MAVVKHGISTDTPDRLLIDSGAVYLGFHDADSPGTLLGATRGGNSFELTRTIRRIDPDGARGPVKGFRRIEEVVAVIKANMLELTAENLRRAIAGAYYSSGTTLVENEAAGTGDGVTIKFNLAHSPGVENSETVTVAAVEKTRGTDYAMDYANGQIQFFVAPANTAAIVATYTYVSAAAVIAGREVSEGTATIFDSYIDNVVIVGTLTGKTNPVIVEITNALCDAGFSIAMAPKDEAVIELTFTGHYANTDLATEPWSVIYPAA